MKFQELSDKQWEFVSELLQPPARTGRPRADDRNIINDILYVLTNRLQVDGHACKIRQ
jgi:transposase